MDGQKRMILSDFISREILRVLLKSKWIWVIVDEKGYGWVQTTFRTINKRREMSTWFFSDKMYMDKIMLKIKEFYCLVLHKNTDS
ncbi:hypothetical protein RO3G_08973 [Rhizopus delemar RA 99-880]|uniref:Uncharacterized protein n=1 Tax=Rhizopus delemar (strain RA 99-880 / ATCC MYA-4621 / FGSC 9543 / NRRL 43880) TaxID=246409 RepID=I1C733_RHIO9|nr:hypothetical protein RO3G_08973 [Rhizopus delemar RA 99-880]|eukprot:EIE84263.1 hypothetical protein RO3G_08973 [Rhizopus delemar RA 99-880]